MELRDATNMHPSSEGTDKLSNSTPNIAWSPNQYLWLHLNYDLTFAATSRTSAPFAARHDKFMYRRFLEYPALGVEHDTGATPIVKSDKCLQHFTTTRDALVPIKQSKIWIAQKQTIGRENSTRIRALKITPPMVMEYKRLRGDLAVEAEIPSPEDFPDLWKFLNTVIDDQYPILKDASSAQMPHDSGAHTNPAAVSSSQTANNDTSLAAGKPGISGKGSATSLTRPLAKGQGPKRLILRCKIDWSILKDAQCTAVEDTTRCTARAGKISRIDALTFRCSKHQQEEHIHAAWDSQPERKAHKGVEQISETISNKPATTSKDAVLELKEARCTATVRKTNEQCHRKGTVPRDQVEGYMCHLHRAKSMASEQEVEASTANTKKRIREGVSVPTSSREDLANNLASRAPDKDTMSLNSAPSEHTEANQGRHAKRKIDGMSAEDLPTKGRTRKRVKTAEPSSSDSGTRKDAALVKRIGGHTPLEANETIEPHPSKPNIWIFRYKAKLPGSDEEFEQVDEVNEFDSTASVDYDDKGKVCIYTIPRHGIPQHKAGQIWKWNEEEQVFVKGTVTWKPVAIVRTFEKNTNKYISYALGSKHLDEMDLNVKNEARDRYGRWLSNHYKSHNTDPVNDSKLQWHQSERTAFYEYINKVIKTSKNGILDLEKNLNYREAAERINAVRAQKELKGKDRTHNAVQSQWNKASKVRDPKIFDLKQRFEKLETWEEDEGRDKEHPPCDPKIGIRIDHSAQYEVDEEAGYEDEDD